MLALEIRSTVATKKALELGSEILFSPRLFPQYHENYYASFWFDPHGFLLEVVSTSHIIRAADDGSSRLIVNGHRNRRRDTYPTSIVPTMPPS